MTRVEKLARALGLLAPLAGWALLLSLGGAIALSVLRAEGISGRGFAWLSAVLVLLWLAGHLGVAVHGRRGRGFGRDQRAELAFELGRDHGFARCRDALRRRGRWYAGRSHSGERPRFD